MNSNIEKIIEESIENVLIDYIVEKVIEKIVGINKKALVVFTGATIGFKQSIECIKKLKDDGWQLEVVLSKGASSVLTESLVKELLDINDIIKEDDNIDVHKLVDENNMIIIPTLTINSCSKIVNCISDSIATNIVSYALMKGKKVVASINGCCPDNEERISLFGDNLSPLRKEILKNNLISLKQHGIVTTKSENIDYKVSKIFKNIYGLNKQTNIAKQDKLNNNKFEVKTNTSCKIENNSNEVYLDKKIISRVDIYENRKFKSIRLNKNSIITDLAKEEALRLKINLLK
ncbi:MAG: flavoprotein [Peptostreptococcaceae bacterium]